MKCRKAYGIMPVGENDRSAHVAQQKAPEVATPGLFYSVLGGWLNPISFFHRASAHFRQDHCVKAQFLCLLHSLTGHAHSTHFTAKSDFPKSHQLIWNYNILHAGCNCQTDSKINRRFCHLHTAGNIYVGVR